MDAESAVEKSKSRVEITAEELERVLLQKEGESVKDNGVQGRSPGGVGGRRVIGKAVAKGGMLLKGKNPGNVSPRCSGLLVRTHQTSIRFKGRKTIFAHACLLPRICIARMSPIPRPFDRSTSISSYRAYYE